MGSGNQEMLIEHSPGDSRLCVPGAEASGFNRNVWNVWERRSVQKWLGIVRNLLFHEQDNLFQDGWSQK